MMKMRTLLLVGLLVLGLGTAVHAAEIGVGAIFAEEDMFVGLTMEFFRPIGLRGWATVLVPEEGAAISTGWAGAELLLNLQIGNLTPYVGPGVGYKVNWGSEFTLSDGDLQGLLTGGVKFAITKNLVIYGEGRYILPYVDNAFAEEGIITYGGGLTIRF